VGQFWPKVEDVFCRQKGLSSITASDVIGPQSYQIRWNKAKRAITP